MAERVLAAMAVARGSDVGRAFDELTMPQAASDAQAEQDVRAMFRNAGLKTE